ncbi:MAG: hypothetical protein HYV07_03770 [Deltaproteobacteria bacterium]|nr:hypothetical protein [Deltaproteobacteria bacterium]
MPRRRPLPKRLISRLLRHPLAATSALSFTYRLGKNSVELATGTIDSKEFGRSTGENLGAVSLGAAGSHFGRLAGAAIPGAGLIAPILGAFAGMTVGEVLGARLGRAAVVEIQRRGSLKDPDLHLPKKSI